MTQAIQKEMQKLKEEVLYHQEMYFVKEDPLITDEDYDTLYDRLLALENLYPQYIELDSPGQRIGYRSEHHLTTFKHPLLLRNNILFFHKESILRYIEKLSNPKLELLLKFKGVEVVLYYRNGLLETGATVGNLREGEDISSNLRTLYSIPLRIKETNSLMVRGIVTTGKNKEKLEKAKGSVGNWVLQALKQNDPSVTANKDLSFIAHEVTYLDQYQTHVSHQNSISTLLGIDQSGLYLAVEHFQEIVEYLTKLEKTKNKYPYEIEGVFVKILDESDFPLTDEIIVYQFK